MSQGVGVRSYLSIAASLTVINDSESTAAVSQVHDHLTPILQAIRPAGDSRVESKVDLSDGGQL